MASGRENQLAHQIGEYLAAAELARRGSMVTLCPECRPDFDMRATDSQGRTLQVKVSAIRSPSWQLNAGQFLQVGFEQGVQVVRGPKPTPADSRTCIFVRVAQQLHDEFHVFRWRELQRILLEDYKGGARPKNPETLHHALYPKRIAHFKANWDVHS